MKQYQSAYSDITYLQLAHILCTRYFLKMLGIFSSPPFYTNFVHLPDIHSLVSPYIAENSKFYPFFNGVIGALDGTYFDCLGTPEQCAIAHNCKGCVMQNCLAACVFTHTYLAVMHASNTWAWNLYIWHVMDLSCDIWYHLGCCLWLISSSCT